MLRKILFYSIVVLLFFNVLVFPLNQYQTVSADSNITLLGRLPMGYCYAANLLGEKYVIVGSERGVRILDVSNNDCPIMVSEVHTSGVVSDVFVSGNYAYITTNGTGIYVSEDFSGGLTIVDVSDAKNPKVISFLDFNEQCFVVRVKGNYAYVAGLNIIWVVNVSNPSEPLKKTNINLNATAHGMFIDGENLFVTAQSDGFNIFSLSDPVHPSLVGKYETWAEKSFVQDTLAFITGQSNKIEILSINDLSVPYKVGEISTSDTSFDQYYGITALGNYLFASGRNGNRWMIKVFDFIDPVNPTITGEYTDSLTSSVSSYGTDIFIRNNYAYIPSVTGLRIINIQDKNNPIQINNYETLINIRDVQIKGNIAYMVFNNIAGGIIGLSVIDVSNPGCLSDISYSIFQLSESTISPLKLELYLNGDYAFISQSMFPDSLNGIRIMNIANPSDPFEVNFLKLKKIGWGIASTDNYLYVETINADTLRTFDISDIQSPRLIGTFGIDAWQYGFPQIYVISSEHLFVGTSLGLLIFDISNPAIPILNGFYKLENGFYNVNGISVEGNTAYLATDYGAMSVNISDAYNPTKMAYEETYNNARDVETINGDIYVTSNQGIKILNELNDTTFSVVGYYDEKYRSATRMSTDGKNVYVVYDGLMIFRKGYQTNVETQEKQLPVNFKLFQNYPNPFNPNTTIEFVLPKAEVVNLKVYNILGEEVAELVNREMKSGNYKINFDASNLSSGLYFYRIKAGDFVDVKKMMLLK